MGGGRKTETYTLAKDNLYAPGYGNMHVRNLKKGDLCGVIFGCKFSTIKECYAKRLFGLPAPHMAYIQNIDPGLTLFLFNYSDRTLHGIFEAASEGKMNIDPKAWSLNGTDPSPYPAQVKMRIRVRCEPLVEEKFSPVIAENYKDDKMFWFELDRGQTNKLLRMFSPAPSVNVRNPSALKDKATTSKTTPKKAVPASSLTEIGASGATRVDKWSSLFKATDESAENNGKDSTEGGTQRAVSKSVNLGTSRGLEVPASNADKGKAQQPVSHFGASYSSVVKNQKEVSLAPSQASKANNVIGPVKEVSAEDTCTEIDWDAASAFKVHVDRVSGILEEPMAGFMGHEGNGGSSFASSSMVRNHWEDEIVPSEFEQGNTVKSPCASSYVSAMTGDTLDEFVDDREKHLMECLKLEMGSSLYVDVLNDLYLAVKELQQTQKKQDTYMISMQMELLDARREIIQLKARNAGS